MSVINPLAREISAKLVYYGPGLSGKTSSLSYVHQVVRPERKGQLISLATEGDRTLYFDFLPIELAKVRDMTVRLQLYTVPGQVFYGATRRLVLEGADAVIFVADSQRSAMERNVESLDDLERNLKELGTSLQELPHVIQYNKRDLPDCADPDTLRASLNRYNAHDFETVASTGEGVIDALRMVTRLLIESLALKAPKEDSVKLRRPLEFPPVDDSQPPNSSSSLGDALRHMGESLRAPVLPNIHARSSASEAGIPQAPDLNSMGNSSPPRGANEPAEQKSEVTHNQQTIQAPATNPLSFAALWQEQTLVKKIEDDIGAGYFAEAVYRATGGVSAILDDLLGVQSPETSATRAQLLGLDGHEYLELRRLGSRPAATITQKDALFALYLLVAAHLKATRLQRGPGG